MVYSPIPISWPKLLAYIINMTREHVPPITFKIRREGGEMIDRSKPERPGMNESRLALV
jgi:hypothetical protein